MPTTGNPWNVWSPDEDSPWDAVHEIFAQQAQSVAAALDDVAATAAVRASSGSDRTAKVPSPTNGREIYRTDKNYKQTYFGVGNGVTTAGWYVEPGVTKITGPNQLNPVPNAPTNVPGQSLTFVVAAGDVLMFDLDYLGSMQQNVAMNSDMRILLNGGLISSVDWNTSVAMDKRPAANRVRVGLTAGTHTIVMQTYSSVPGASVLYRAQMFATTVSPINSI